MEMLIGIFIRNNQMFYHNSLANKTNLIILTPSFTKTWFGIVIGMKLRANLILSFNVIDILISEVTW